MQKREVMNTNSALREQAIGVRNELLERRNLTGHERTVIMQWLQFNNHEANILMASRRLEELNAKLELRTTTIKDKEGHQLELEGLNAPTPEQWRECGTERKANCTEYATKHRVQRGPARGC